MDKVSIIGAGLAGCECAYILAKNGVSVDLYEMKKSKRTPAQNSDNFAELVCSNSLKSNEITNACGLLKEEMRHFNSIMTEAALVSKVDAGNSLSVDRNIFSDYITKKLLEMENINYIDKEITDINDIKGTVVIATGPLTSEDLFKSILKKIGEDSLYFYDAAAPIVDASTINMEIAYLKNRWKDDEEGDYLNLPMTEEEYNTFYNELVNAKRAPRHDFEKLQHFEGCMPIEDMAKRGDKTLIFGPLKPVGLRKTCEHKPYAVVQLRAENEQRTMYNLVGFQTSLRFGEQKRVFRLIPGLENAEFLRYGVMHRNTYINSPKLLTPAFCLKADNNIYFAGQISGVEGYVESAASGLMVGLNILLNEKNKSLFNNKTMLGALSTYISTENKDFQPMNANFGIIEELKEKIRDKKKKYEMYANRSLEEIRRIRDELKNIR